MNPEFEKRLTKIENEIKRVTTLNDQWKTNSFGNLPEGVCAENGDLYLKCLLEPNTNLISQGGKRWRPLFATLVADLVGADSDLAYSLCPIVEFVHTASLIHDDIEDGADLRRGKPCAHITFGLDTALNSGAWFYFEALSIIDALDISDSQKLQLHKIVSQELRRLHLGQAMDIYWHRNPAFFPAEKEYEAMVRQKTGTLANLAAQLGAMAGGASQDLCEKLGETASFVGMGFQIIDDVINLTTGNVGKKRGDDIVEGKKSLPVLIHVQEHPEDKEKIAAFMDQARREGIDSPAVEQCISLLETSGCIEKAWERGIAVLKEACAGFRALGNLGKGAKTSSEVSSKAADLIEELFLSMVPVLK
ncbi:MAG: polyprenyl synthetase family protein [Treponema sp.]|nr:polyprenyl synthetase family protein [Treponema sp.]